MFKIIVNSNALQRNLMTFFHVTGGTPIEDEITLPHYQMSLRNGGIGGNIVDKYILSPQGRVSAIYTSPPIVGSETIIATDANGDTAELEMNTLNTIGILADIIKREMGLAQDQVFIYNQEFTIPPDERMYISVRPVSIKPFANNNEYEVSPDGLNSVQFANFSSIVDIHVMSKSEEALDRKEEVFLALNSDFSFTQQDANLIYIPKISTQFVDVPDIEGGSRLFHFIITINLHYSERKTKPTSFFDDFGGVRVFLEEGRQFLVPIEED